MKLSRSIAQFLQKQKIVVVSTIDPQGRIHGSVKGIVGIEEEGKIFVIDLYMKNTYNNLLQDPRISVTAVDEHNFAGYTFQGRGRIVPREEIRGHIMAQWEDRITARISQRIVRRLQSESEKGAHFEAGLPPNPKYLMEIDVENIVDLSPPRLRGERAQAEETT